MDIYTTNILREYFAEKEDVFTIEQFCKEIKLRGLKINKTTAYDVLRSSNYVFALVNNEYITRAGVFKYRWFSFKPSKEEVEKGAVLIGHRCLPFINPDVSPDSVNVVANGRPVESTSTVFSMNLALDTFTLYGEGYVLPYIMNDKANDEVPLSSVQYSLPKELKLTSWPLSQIAGSKNFEYGDRILCRVIDWYSNQVEMIVQKQEASKMQVSSEVIERENWYSFFEEGLLQSFDKNGPAESIEEQLAFLYLENQEQLCIKNCGSAEEFLKHTNKIGFSPFGVETRIWRDGEDVPYIGEWNKNYTKDILMTELSVNFIPPVIDAFLEDYIYREKSRLKMEPLSDLLLKIFPEELNMTENERQLVLLNIEKRRDILLKDYNQFSDHPVAEVRRNAIKLFSEVSSLLCSIGCSGIDVQEFPQQELIILTQLYNHIAKLLEEVETKYLRTSFPKEDVELSLEGMKDTFEDISGSLICSLKNNKYKGFELLK